MLNRNTMKTILALAAVAGFGSAAHAAVFSWDADGAYGGSGTWSTTNSNWWSGSATTAWVSGNDAVFGGTAGTVTLGAALTAGTMTFNTSGYIIDTGAYNLTGTNGLAGSGNFTKNGAGVLYLGGTGNYSGTFTIGGGYLELQGSALTLSNAVLNIGSGANTTRAVDLWAGNLTIRGLTGGTSSTNIVSNGGNTLIISTQSNDNYTYSGVLADRTWGSAVLSVTKQGSGTQTFSTVNTFTGQLTVSGGTLVASAGTSGSASATGNNNTIVVNSGATLIYTASRGAGYHAGNVTINGGTITFNNADMSFACGKTLTFDTAAGTINGTGQWRRRDANNKVAVTAAGSGSVISVAELNLFDSAPVFEVADGSNAVDLTISSASITGSSLTKTGAGVLKISGSGSYTGGTTISAGTIIAANANALSTSGTVTLNNASTGTSNTGLLIDATSAGITIARSITIANQGTGTTTLGSATSSGTNQAIFSGAVTLNKDVTLNGGASGDSLRFTGGISGTGNVTIAGTNRVLFSGTANSYAGGTTVNSGSFLQLGDGSGTTTSFIPDASVLVANGTLNLAKGANSETIGGLSGSGTVQGHPAVGSIASALVINSGTANSFSGVLSNGGASGATLSLTMQGTGTQTLSGINTYTGGTTISGGTLVLGHATNTLADTGAVNVNGGTLTIGANNDTVGAITLTSGSITGSTGVLTGSSYAVQSGTVSAILGGTGALTKSTTGTVTMSGASAYTGATNVNAGLLNITGSLAAGSAVTVASGAMLGGSGTMGNVGVTGTLTGTLTGGGVTVNNGGVLTPGVSGSGTLTMSSLTLGTIAGDTATINIGTSGLPGSAITSSALQVNGNITANGGAGKATFAFGGALANLASGTYHLINYTGTQLSDVSAFTYSGTAGAREGVTLVNGTNAVDLAITAAYPIWTGATSSDWSAGSGNWKLNTDSSGTYFIANDTVVFDDSASSGTVNLTADVNPLSTTFSGNTLAYTLGSTGGYKITSGSLVKTGSGTLTINNANTFSGGTTITGGAMVLGNGGALGSGTVALNGGTLDVGSYTFTNGIVLGGGALAFSGATISGNISETGGAKTLTVGASLTLSGSNSYSNGTALNGGTLTAGGNYAFGGGAITLNGGTLDINGKTIANGITLNGGAISGNGGTLSGVIANGTASALTVGSSLTLSGSNTYTGGTTLNAGTLNVSTAASLGAASGALTFGGNSTLQLGGSFASGRNYAINTGVTATVDTNGNALTHSGVISGNGSLTKSGSGTLALSGANTYAGKTGVTGGVLAIAADSGLGTAPGAAVADQLTLNGGTLQITAAGQTLAANRGITLGSSGGTIDTSVISGGAITTTIGGVITGTGPLTLKSTGDMSAGGGGDGGLGIKLNSSTNTFIGDVTITSGLVSYAANGSFGNAANKIILNGGGLLDPNSSIALSRNIQVLSGGGTFRTYGSVTTTWSGAITGSGNINHTDGGTLTLSGDLSGYTGTYNNQAGTTTMSNKIVAGALTISGGTTVNLNGTGTAGTVSSNGGTLGIGASANVTVGTINHGASGGSFSVAAGGVLNATSYTASYNPSTFAVNGTMTLSGPLTFSTASTWGVTGTGTITAGGYANNNYTNITFNGERLNLGGNMTLGSGSITLNGTTVGAYANWTGSAAMTLTGTNTFNTLDSKDGTTARLVTVSGVLSGAGALTKTGTGTLALSAANTYTGTTVVSAGTLSLAHASTAGESTVYNGITVNSGATLLIAAGDTLGWTAGRGALTVSGGTVITAAGKRATIANTIVMTGGTLAGVDAGDTWGNYSLFGAGITATSDASGNPAMISCAKLALQDSGGLTAFNVTRGATSPASDLTITGAIVNMNGSNNGISKTGDGIMTLSGTNSYAGGTTISAGTLSVSTSNAVLGTGAVAVGASGTLAITDARTLANAFSGSGVVNVSGADTTTLSGNLSAFTGTINVNTPSSGISKFYFSSPAAMPSASSSVNVANGSTFYVDVSTYAGTVNVLGVGNSEGLGALRLDNGAAVSGAVHLLGATSVGTNSGTGTISGVIDGAYALTKVAAGTLVLSGSNGYTGGTTVNAGTLTAGGDRAFGTGAIALNAGTLNVGAHAVANNITLGGGALSFNGATLSGSISETGGSRSLAVGASLTLSGSNSYTGGTTVSAGTLTVENDRALGTGAVALNGGTLNVGGYALANNIVLGGGVLSFNGATLNGVISETGGARLLTVGANLTLSGSNSYSGGTTVNAGTLTLGNNNALGTNAVTLNAGGTLNVGGHTVANDITLGGGDLAFNGATLDGHLTGVGALTVGSTSGETLTLNASNSYSGGTTVKNEGTLTLGHANALGSNTVTIGDASTGGYLQWTTDCTVGNDMVTNATGVSYGAFDPNGHAVVLSGSISGSGNLGVYSSALDGSGSVTLSSSNTYTGTTLVASGTLVAGNAHAFGSNSIAVNGGVLDLAGFGVANVIAVGASGKLVGASNQSLANVTFADGAAMTGSFGSFNTGTNPLKAYNVTGGATYSALSGQGAFTGGLVTVTGAYAPGNSPGTQTFDTGLALSGATTLEIDSQGVNGTNGLPNDFINITGGGLDLSSGTAMLNLNLYGSPDYATTYWDVDHSFTLIHAGGGVTGSFADISLLGLGTDVTNGAWTAGWVDVGGGNQDYVATWTAVVPEPGTLGLLALGALALLGRRRGRRE